MDCVHGAIVNNAGVKENGNFHLLYAMAELGWSGLRGVRYLTHRNALGAALGRFDGIVDSHADFGFGVKAG